jgi:hypothetical protein
MPACFDEREINSHTKQYSAVPISKGWPEGTKKETSCFGDGITSKKERGWTGFPSWIR